MQPQPRTPTRPAQQPPPSQTARSVAPFMLWFSVLGGAMSWALHLLVTWPTVELTCTSGHDRLLGVPLRVFAAVSTGLPGLVAAIALLLSWRLARHRLRVEGGGRRIERARFMAEIGMWSNVLSLLMIILGGVAVGVLQPCAR